MNLNIELNKVGADPELFFVKDGHPWSAEGLVGGTKAEPRPIVGLPPGFCVQEDNVSAEFNIPPAGTPEEFSGNVAKVLTYLKKVAKKHKCELSFEPALDFPIEQVSTPHARLMGCDPDFSVWTMDVNPRPIAPPQMRTAAGHVHISWFGEVDFEMQTIVGRACDVFLGLPHVLSTDRSRRRELYGKAGCIRPKDWGLEYRTMDCSWTKHMDIRKQVFRNISHMFCMLREDNNLPHQITSWGDEIQEAINTHNKELCRKIMGAFDVPSFPEIRAA
jgi:hypothetical protein